MTHLLALLLSAAALGWAVRVLTLAAVDGHRRGVARVHAGQRGDYVNRKMPLLDKVVYRIVGDVMCWLGKRAWDRKDIEFFDAMRDALHAGHVQGRLKSTR